MVVVIASTGDVTKRIFEFNQPLDAGLTSWAASYMNERLAGLAIGSRQLMGRLRDVELAPVERSFIDRIATAFVHFNELDEGEVYYDGTARLIAQTQSEGVSALNELIDSATNTTDLTDFAYAIYNTENKYIEFAVNQAMSGTGAATFKAAYDSLGFREAAKAGLWGGKR